MKKLAVLLTAIFMTFFISALVGLATQSEARGRGAQVATIEQARVFNRNYNAVWQTIIKVMTSKGYSILNMDKSSGLISTDYFVVREPVMIIQGYRYKLNILLEKISASKTQVTITSVWEIGFQQAESGLVRWQTTQRRDVNLERNLFDSIQSLL
jgi:hypothetical protein